MKRSYLLAILIILVIFISGCRAGRPVGGGNVPTTTTFREQQPGTYTLKVGDGISVSGKTIKLLEVSSANGLVTLNVDGEVVEFPITRLAKVVRNLEIQTIRVDYGKTPEDNTATIDIKLFQVGQNEYYMQAGQSVTVAGTVVKFDDLTKTDGVRLTISTSQSIVLEQGQSQNVLNLQITYKKVYDNPVKINRYALIEIKSV